MDDALLAARRSTVRSRAAQSPGQRGRRGRARWRGSPVRAPENPRETQIGFCDPPVVGNSGRVWTPESSETPVTRGKGRWLLREDSNLSAFALRATARSRRSPRNVSCGRRRTTLRLTEAAPEIDQVRPTTMKRMTVNDLRPSSEHPWMPVDQRRTGCSEGVGSQSMSHVVGIVWLIHVVGFLDDLLVGGRATVAPFMMSVVAAIRASV